MKSRLSELRSVDLFGGLTDQQLSELVAGSTEISLRPGLELFREGEHADFWWVLLDGVVDLVRRVGREETIVAKMDVPGRWAGGFRAWDDQGVYLATGRAATTGRVLRIHAEVLRERVSAWLPLGGYLIEGLYRTARSIEATARQRQSLVTLGTLAAGLAHEINNPAAAAVRAVDAQEDACQALLASVSQLAAQRVSAQQFGALDMLRQEVTSPVGRAGRAGAGRPGGNPGVVAYPPWCRPRMGDRALTRRCRGRPRLVRPGGQYLGWTSAGAGPGVGGKRLVGRPVAGGDEGVEPAYLSADRRGQVLLADGPCFDAAHRRHRGPREHPGDAQP